MKAGYAVSKKRERVGQRYGIRSKMKKKKKKNVLGNRTIKTQR